MGMILDHFMIGIFLCYSMVTAFLAAQGKNDSTHRGTELKGAPEALFYLKTSSKNTRSVYNNTGAVITDII